jgi:DnaK suppressor protein
MEQRLLRVEHALSKIESGTYGRCDICGQPIEPERLEVLPEAELCYRCKTHRKNQLMVKPGGKRQASN